jgi:hypothetical protein
MDDKLKTSLEAFEKYLKETPKEEQQKIADKVKVMGLEGYTFEEYVDALTKFQDE